jgi:hypothetical protein
MPIELLKLAYLFKNAVGGSLIGLAAQKKLSEMGMNSVSAVFATLCGGNQKHYVSW